MTSSCLPVDATHPLRRPPQLPAIKPTGATGTNSITLDLANMTGTTSTMLMNITNFTVGHYHPVRFEAKCEEETHIESEMNEKQKPGNVVTKSSRRPGFGISLCLFLVPVCCNSFLVSSFVCMSLCYMLPFISSFDSCVKWYTMFCENSRERFLTNLFPFSSDTLFCSSLSLCPTYFVTLKCKNLSYFGIDLIKSSPGGKT